MKCQVCMNSNVLIPIQTNRKISFIYVHVHYAGIHNRHILITSHSIIVFTFIQFCRSMGGGGGGGGGQQRVY